MTQTRLLIFLSALLAGLHVSFLIDAAHQGNTPLAAVCGTQALWMLSSIAFLAVPRLQSLRRRDNFLWYWGMYMLMSLTDQWLRLHRILPVLWVAACFVLGALGGYLLSLRGTPKDASSETGT